MKWLLAILVVLQAGCMEYWDGHSYDIPVSFWIDSRFPHPELIPQILEGIAEINSLCPAPALLYEGLSNNGGLVNYPRNEGHVTYSVVFGTDGGEDYIWKGDKPEDQVLSYEVLHGATDCDIYMFNMQHNFIDGRTDYPPEHSTVHIKAVIIHEFLHCMGVYHSDNPQDIMYPSFSGHMNAIGWANDDMSSGDVAAFYKANPKCLKPVWVNNE